MGMVIHRTLVVTGADYGKSNIDSDPINIKDIHAKAKEIMASKTDSDYTEGLADHVTELVGGMNSTLTFMVGTSGSKEGWGLASMHQEGIEELIDFIEKNCYYEDGSHHTYYYLMEYGGDLPCMMGDDDPKYFLEKHNLET